jgi:formylglycine-generating enzyme required for sulfatase activity
MFSSNNGITFEHGVKSMIRAHIVLAMALMQAVCGCQPQHAPRTDAGNETVTNQFGMAFRRIPAGVHAAADGQMQELGSFCLQRTEFTYRQLRALESKLKDADAQAASTDESDLDYPVALDSWNEASNLAAALSKIDEKYDYRLPTVAEWTYACAGGADVRGELAAKVVDNLPSDAGPLAPAMTREPNKFGLYDMLGNLGEYCADACDTPELANIELRVVKGMPSESLPRTFSIVDRKCVERTGSEDLLIGARFVLECTGEQ